jgi:hypothetical protein
MITDEERKRYTRKILMIGEAGQERLKAASGGSSARQRRSSPGRPPAALFLPPDGSPPQEIPIIGATCGVIGAIEATEAIKLLTGQGEPLAGRLFRWDGLSVRADSVTVERDPSCPVCGKL